jgi:hypothetical protein
VSREELTTLANAVYAQLEAQDATRAPAAAPGKAQ